MPTSGPAEVSTHRVLYTFSRMPFLFAISMLVALYLLRWPMLGGAVAGIGESILENAIGNDIEIEVGDVSGSLFFDIAFSDISTVHEATDGLVRSVDLDAVRADYYLVEFLPLLSATVVPWFPVAGSDVEWIEPAITGQETVDPALLVMHADELIPDGTTVSANGQLLIRTVTGRFRPRIDLTARAADETDAPVAEVYISELDADSEVAEAVALEQLRARVWTPENAVSVEALANEGKLARISAAIRAAGDSESPFLDGLNLNVHADGTRVSATATRTDITASVEIAEDNVIEPLARALAADLELSVGTLTAGIDAVAPTPSGADEPEVSLVDTLFDSPGELPQVSRAEASLDASDWKLLGGRLDSLGAQIGWDKQGLSIANAQARGRLVGFFASEGEPSPEIVLFADSVEYAPDTRELAIERVRLSAGSGTLVAGGSIDLDGGGQVAWTEATGQLSGRLTVANPARMISIISSTRLLESPPPVDFTEDGQVGVVLSVEGTEEGPVADVDLSVEDALVSGAQLGSLDVGARVRPNTAYLRRLTATVEEYDLRLAEPTRVRWSDAGFSLAPTRIVSDHGDLFAEASLGSQRWELVSRLESVDIQPLIRLINAELSEQASGTISADVSVQGNPASPTARLELRSNELVIQGAGSEMLVTVVQEERQLELRQLSVELGNIARIQGDGVIPAYVSSAGISTGDLALTEVELNALVLPSQLLPDFDLEPWAGSRISAEVLISGDSGSAEITASRLSPESRVTLAGVRPFTRLTLSTEFTNILSRSVQVNGRALGDQTRILEFAGGIGLEDEATPASVDLVVDLDLPVERVSHWIPGLSLLGGTIAGRVEVAGSTEDLDLGGQVEITDALVKLAAGIPTISALNGSLEFSNDALRIEELYGRMGQEPISVSGRVGLPDEGLPQFDLQIEGDGVLLARTPDIVARGDVSAQVVSSSDATRVIGNLNVLEVRYTKPIQLLSLGSDAESPASGIELFYVEAPWARSVSLNIRVVADQTIEVDNNLFAGTLSADLRIRGSLAVPRPDGRVFASDGVVTLPTADLQIQQLRVVFPTDASFQPSVFARANANVQGYDMSIVVDGQFPNVEIDVASSPALPTDAALVLLATGREPSQLSFGSEGGALRAVGTVLGRTLLSEIADSLDREGGGFFERLSFDIQQNEESEIIGNIKVEYQFAEGEPWFLLIERTAAEKYNVELAWRLWTE